MDAREGIDNGVDGNEGTPFPPPDSRSKGGGDNRNNGKEVDNGDECFDANNDSHRCDEIKKERFQR